MITTSRELAAEQRGSPLDRTLAKVSWRLLPFLLLLYVIAWFDRVNISFAALQMNGDLGFSSSVYGFGAGIFYVGYARARRVIWAGFVAMLFATLMSVVVIGLPPTPTEPFNATLQPALVIVFGNTWRIVAASIVGFWVGDFVNAYVLARMKVWTRGRWLWTRTIGSTIVGEGVDSAIFYPIAFAGIWEGQTIVRTIIFNWCFKVLVEVVLTPVTYAVVGWLKRHEHEDYYDTDTNFTPFSLQD